MIPFANEHARNSNFEFKTTIGGFPTPSWANIKDTMMPNSNFTMSSATSEPFGSTNFPQQTENFSNLNQAPFKSRLNPSKGKMTIVFKNYDLPKDAEKMFTSFSQFPASSSSTTNSLAGDLHNGTLAAARNTHESFAIKSNTNSFLDNFGILSFSSDMKQSDFGNDDLHSASFPVKHRRRTSREQLYVLESSFRVNARPNASERTELAMKLGMSTRAVQIWFQNRRAKSKQMTKKCHETFIRRSMHENKLEHAQNSSIPYINEYLHGNDEIDLSNSLSIPQSHTAIFQSNNFDPKLQLFTSDAENAPFFYAPNTEQSMICNQVRKGSAGEWVQVGRWDNSNRPPRDQSLIKKHSFLFSSPMARDSHCNTHKQNSAEISNYFNYNHLLQSDSAPFASPQQSLLSHENEPNSLFERHDSDFFNCSYNRMEQHQSPSFKVIPPRHGCTLNQDAPSLNSSATRAKSRGSSNDSPSSADSNRNFCKSPNVYMTSGASFAEHEQFMAEYLNYSATANGAVTFDLK